MFPSIAKRAGARNLLAVLIISLSVVPFCYFTTVDLRQPESLPEPAERSVRTSPAVIRSAWTHNEDNSRPDASMGACLLVKDDNPLLYEWISYHYTVLPLRYLLIASDEGSETDPSDVLDRWNGTDLHYWVWSADDFVPGIRYRYGDQVYRFMKRQGRFYKRCLKFMKDQNLTWVSLVDSDEYIRWNPYDPQNDIRLTKKQLASDKHQKYFNFGRNDSFAARLETRKWMLHEQDQDDPYRKTVLHVLQNTPFVSSPCHSMTRYQYTAVTDQLECPWTPRNLDFLYTRQFNHHVGSSNPLWGKVLVDVSRVPRRELNDVEYSSNPHGPLGSCLRPPALHFVASLFIVNHYLGKLDRYAARSGDDRRNVDNWIRYANQTDGQDCETGRWIDTFWDQFAGGSVDTARFLLGMDN